MTVDYASARADAAAGIAEGGVSASLLRRGASTGDAFNPTPGTETTHACTVLILDYSQRDRDGSMVRAEDRKVLISAEGLTIVPGPEDRLTVGGTTYRLVRVMPFQPGGVTVFYEAQARL